MAEIAINRNTFPAEGGDFRVEITKNDARPWVVTFPTASWHAQLEQEVSNHLYRIDFSFDPNTNAADRSFTLIAGSDLTTEAFTITQYGTGSTLTAEVIAATAGNIPAAGGQMTIDIYANGGTDSLSSAAVSVGNAFCTLASTTHGVSSGGYTCTRFVFTFDENTSTSARSATATFTVSDGLNTATASVTKAQNGAIIQSGSLSVASQNAAAADTSADAPITETAMNTATLAVDTTTFNFVTNAAVAIVSNQPVLQLTFPANTNASSRTETIQISGTDNWGNTITATMTLTQAGTSLPANRISNIYWDNTSPYSSYTETDYAGFNQRIILAFTGSWNGDTQVSYSPDSRLSVTILSNTQIRVEYSAGSIAQDKTLTFTISREDVDGVIVTATASLRLLASGVFPIWQDVFGAIVTDEDYVDYELQEGGSLLYSGRAFAYPDESSIKVNLSRVVAPYLTGYYKDITFHANGSQIGAYTFVRDYSYDTTMDYTQDLWLNRPVNGRVPSGVKLSASKWAAASGGSLQVSDEGGSLVVNESMVKGLNTGEWISGSIGKAYTLGSEKYEVVEACRGALLKYVNAYGAVDFLLVEGVAKKQDKITRASYEKDAAAMTKDFESRDYQATMEANWTGTTGWLTDSQSLRMKHLVESVEVYMIDISTGEEIPVVMKDGSLEYKTFDNNGRTLVNYKLTWAESQKKLRR